jgi:CBS domain-containing protein
MRPGVISCPRETTLTAMAATLATHGIHAVLVAPVHGRTQLVVTDMEIVRAAVERTGGVTAATLAREPIAMVSADATLQEAVEVMVVQYVTHLLAIDPVSGSPAGILSSLDVAAVAGLSRPELARVHHPGLVGPLPNVDTWVQATVSDVMHPGVLTCPPDAPLSMVARTMADRRVHCVAITGVATAEDGGQHFTWGLVADIDLVRALHRGTDAINAATIANTEPLAVEEGDSLERAAGLMVEHDARHVVVVSPTGLPSGILSTLDVARVVAARG